MGFFHVRISRVRVRRPCDLGYKSWSEETRVSRLFVGENRHDPKFECITSVVLQTDTQPITNFCCSIAECDKNETENCLLITCCKYSEVQLYWSRVRCNRSHISLTDFHCVKSFYGRTYHMKRVLLWKLCRFQLKNFVYDRIYEAVRNGRRKLAGELMDEKAKTGQTTFNFLHRDVSAINNKVSLIFDYMT